MGDSHKQSFLDHIPKSVLFEWVNKDLKGRPARLAWQIQIDQPENKSKFEWCDLAKKLIGRCPDFSAMLDILTERIYPRSWSGSYADILEKRAALIESIPDTLVGYDSDKISVKVAELRNQIELSREEEKELNRQKFQSFE